MNEIGFQPTAVEALIVIVLVLSPGYLFTQIARHSIPHVAEPSDLRFFLTIVTAGTIIHAIAFPFYTHILLDFYLAGTLQHHQIAVFIWFVTVCLVAPSVLGALSGIVIEWHWVERILDAFGLGYVDRMPCAWDFVMLQQEPRYVRVHLKDGQGMVGGVYQDRSLASVDPKRADLYLEKAWQVDENGSFTVELAGTRESSPRSSVNGLHGSRSD